MPLKNKSKKSLPSPDSVGLQIVGTRNRGNYCVVYNLEDEKTWKKFDLPKSVETNDDWKKIYGILTKECPPKIVKSIFVNMLTVVEVDNYDVWFVKVKKLGMTYGYKNFNWSTNMVLGMVSEFLLAKKNGKKYKIDDCVVIGKYLFLSGTVIGEIHLLKKQEIGWDVVDGTLAEIETFHPDTFEQFVNKNGIIMDQVKDVFLRILDVLDVEIIHGYLKQIYSAKKLTIKRVVYEALAEFLEFPGEYLTKVYSGEDCFTDYDCFVGNICVEKCELQCGKSTIVLPLQFKRQPYTVKKKIKFTKCNEIKVLASCDHMFYSRMETEKRVIFASNVNIDGEVLVVTLTLEQDNAFLFKIERDNDEKTLITSNEKSVTACNLSLCEWKDGRPQFTLGKDYCSVKYYKDGLLWKLKDVNGNEKIPFKLSFDKEIYIGVAALEHPQFLMPEINLEMLVNDKTYHKLSAKHDYFFHDSDKKYKILLNTINGSRKTLSENIIAIFMKSILKLLEKKLGKPVDEIYLKFCFSNNSSTNSVISKTCKLLNICFEERTCNEN